MTGVDFQKRLISYIEKEFNLRVIETQIPPQGMSSAVFFIKTAHDKEYAVKYGVDAMKDIPALDLISKEHVGIPVPSVFGSFLFEDVPVVILEKIQFPLLESIAVQEMPKYILSMIENLRKLHTIKSTSPGLLTEPDSQKTWKEILLDIFIDEVYWQEVSHRGGIDGDLVRTAVDKIIMKINNTKFADEEYSLLHTDFNQRNLFVNPKNHEIAGIVDWEDAMFGDPIYDFSRVRMYLWHFDFDDKTIKEYYELMSFGAHQKRLEDLYWLSRVIQYLGWYSEEVNEFTKGRIKLHQDYLQAYDWLKKF